MHGRHIVVGVCGGVAAYKAIELVRQCTSRGARVSVIMTESAQRFVGSATFGALTHEPVRTSLWNSPEPSPHTMLGQSADAIVIVPATARLVGEYTHGISSDLLVSTLLASRAPVVVAPAMHTEMWEQPAVQANIAALQERGVVVVPPEYGELAGGDVGVGRLAPLAHIVAAVEKALGPGDLEGLRVLVTAGGTREALDPVRYIGNRSSGKQGYAVAEVAAERGALVTLITTVQLPVSSSIEVIEVETAQQMHDAVLQVLAQKDVLVMAAAVADFRPKSIAVDKMKKQAGVPEVVLEPTPDILRDVAEVRHQALTVVGFAAETTPVLHAALQKLRDKQLDMIVANDVTAEGAGFVTDTNIVTIVDKNGRQSVTSLVSKRTVATEIWDRVIRLRGE